MSNPSLISSIHFIPAWANYPHTHAHMETPLPELIHTLLPRRPILPVPHHYATSLITAHSEEFGDSSQPPPQLLPGPLPLLTVGTAIGSCHPCLKHHLWRHRCPACTRARVCVCVCMLLPVTACTHMPSTMSLSLCASVALPAVLFEIHCHVLMVNLPGPSPGGKGWLLA